MAVDDPVVGVDRARDDGVAQARGGVDHAAGAAAADRVGGEEHARDLRVDHPLHDHGELGGRVVDARVGAVGHGPVRPQRRPAAAHRVQHRVDADDVQVGVLLAREARAGQVLRGGRRPDRDGHVLAERRVRVRRPRRRRRRGPAPRAGPAGRGRQARGVGGRTGAARDGVETRDPRAACA